MDQSDVRLPFSLEQFYHNPIVETSRLTANPELQGQTSLEVLEAVQGRVETSHWSRSIEILCSHWLMMLLRQLSYALKTTELSFLAFRCVFMA